MINYAKARAWQSGDVRQAYAAKDTILYALGLGLGSDPLDTNQLRFTYEKDLLALPTMAAVLASPGPWMRDRLELGIDFLRMVHGEQSIVIHTPLRPSGGVIGRSRVARLVDKGEGKGAIMHVEKELRDEASGDLIATTEQVLFLRGDGGFSKSGQGDPPAAKLEKLPDLPVENVMDLPTRADAALLYRLSGDMNPLHVDPAIAAKAGFPRPILHGLATYGVACHGIVKTFCAYEPARLRTFRARLSSPVFPGEVIRLEARRAGEGEVSFQGRVLEREVVVLADGRATFKV